MKAVLQKKKIIEFTPPQYADRHSVIHFIIVCYFHWSKDRLSKTKTDLDYVIDVNKLLLHEYIILVISQAV